jgi:OOP family OmpA-OmpF porin
MKKLHSLVLACVGLATITSYSAAFTGNRPGAVTFTFGAGYDYFAQKRKIENTGVPFVAVGYDFTDRWGIEGMLGGFNTSFKPSADDDRKINGTLLAVDGVYRFDPQCLYQQYPVEPFVMAGVGILGLSNNRNEANNEGNINAALGVQFFADKVVAFRVEARDFYTIVGGKNDVILDAGVTFLLDLC